MSTVLHQLLTINATCHHDRTALVYQQTTVSYAALFSQTQIIAQGFLALGLQPNQRIAIYLPKQIETVVALFASSMAGAIAVPINPALKSAQVQHIINDATATCLITSRARLSALADLRKNCVSLQQIIVVDDGGSDDHCIAWSTLQHSTIVQELPIRIDEDIAAILYTSGSTGKPKGVVLSHRNLLAGAESVTQYLNNNAEDRILAVLPLSFDYGLSQLTTAFLVGASVYLLDYLMPNDVIKACARYRITGLAAVPPLWMQLSQLSWPDDAKNALRYWTNSGGHMPRSTLDKLRQQLPHARPYLMYGLTEAFRSTYLPPEQIDIRPDSIGKAIPNVEIRVMRDDGSECDTDEVGELVHRGVLVAKGYWNDAEKTAQRFKPLPSQLGLPLPEIAVYSGDKVKKDAEGFLYFVGRNDELIKSNGYRISPTEVEEVILLDNSVKETVVFGVPHPSVGEAIVALYTAAPDHNESTLRALLQQQLPTYMQPHLLQCLTELPRNSNGKMDRAGLRKQFYQSFIKGPTP